MYQRLPVEELQDGLLILLHVNTIMLIMIVPYYYFIAYASFLSNDGLPAAVDQLKIAFQITPNAAVNVTLSSIFVKKMNY